MGPLPPPPNMSPLPNMPSSNAPAREAVCLETLMLTVLLWAGIWGTLEACIDRAGLREKDVAVYLLVCAAALMGVYWSADIDACNVL